MVSFGLQGMGMSCFKCRNCHYFTHHIHHKSSCELGSKPEKTGIRDGRGIACEKFKLKKKKKRVA